MKRLSVFLLLLILALGTDLTRFDFDSLRKDSITVRISGEVEKEGEYQLDLYSTLEDALNEAGVTEEADLSSLNPSIVLKDHDMIHIPQKKEETQVQVSINTGSLEDLCTLKGIGPSTAQRIIDYREENGLFQSLEELMRVKGIGESRFEAIRDDICL